MQDLTVICGECGAKVAVTESLAAPLIEASKKEFERKLADKNKELRDQAAEMEARRVTLLKAEAALDETIQQRVKAAESEITVEAEKKARLRVNAEMATQSAALRDAEALVKTRTNALKDATEAASSLRKEKAELEDEKLKLAATIEDKVGEELRKARVRYQAEHQADLAKKLAEKDEELSQSKLDAEAATKKEIQRKSEETERSLAEQAKELEDAKEDLRERTAELTAAKQAEAAFLREKRQFENEKIQMPLTIQHKVDEEVATSRESLRLEMETELKLQVRSKDIVLESMKAEIENLKRKSEQGSQQLQGEAWERELADILSSRFPSDVFRRIAKGESGADIVQEVYNAQGKLCGSLLWESKRTKVWKDEWLTKLKRDQREMKADTAVIVSHALPKDLKTFDNREDVWVTGPDCLIAVAGSLRHLLIEVASTKRSNEGYKDKAEMVYEYVTSLPFRQRVKALVETYTTMQADLKAERKAITRQWAKREAQLDRMIEATGGMYGDLQGIAGQSVPELEGLGFEALEAGN
ncbi:MAG TPA: DUF2130 domain-containing protein [Acidobacteriaceae bacterium]